MGRYLGGEPTASTASDTCETIADPCTFRNALIVCQLRSKDAASNVPSLRGSRLVYPCVAPDPPPRSLREDAVRRTLTT